MTVIAWDGRTLAADSLTSTSSGFYVGKSKKLYRLKSGGMVGTAGDVDCRAFINLIDNIKEEGDLPSRAEFEALKIEGEYILVLPDKSAWYIDLMFNDESKTHKAAIYLTGDKNAACGHGTDFARAAMYLGKTSVEAVKVACHFSLACAGPIQQMKLEDKPKEKIKRVRQPKPVLHEAD
jgi:hypothetical protein